MSELAIGGSIALLVLLILLEFPVAFAFAAAAIVLALSSGRDLALVLPQAFWQTGGFALLALPLFIMAGIVMRNAGISDRLVAVVQHCLRRVTGGLGAVTVVSCMLFGAISGSGAAAIAAIGSVMIPKMVGSGYDRAYATSLVACSSILALLIPPSIPMIVFALTAGISVTAAFLSTVGPAVLIAGLYIAINRRRAARHGFDRALPASQPSPTTLAGVTIPGIPALFMPVVMLGGIYSGAFTPTEAAAVALIYAMLIGTGVYRTLGPRNLSAALLEGATVTGSVIAILFFLLIFGQLLSLLAVPRQLATALLAVTENYYVVLLMMNVALILLGMLIDDVSGSILAAVILMPVALQIGIDPIHFAAIVGTNLGMGNVTPPCAPLLFVAGSVGRSELKRLVWPTLRFLLLGHLPVVLLVTYWPALSLFLPNALAG